MMNQMQSDDWFSIEEAAGYLGIGKTVLYAQAREGRVPASKIGKKWRFNKAELDSWMSSSKPFETYFENLDAKIESNPHLREPQREAYLRVYDYFKSGKSKAIVQIPVGCGKSGLAALLPLGIAEGRVLIISPNLNIKDGLFATLDVTNRQKCFWRKTKVLDNAQMLTGPLACTLSTGNISVAEKSHIVVTNIHQLSANVDKWLTQFPDRFFDLIIIDEAHHSAAASWQRVLDRFPEAKVVLMTATPFRSDRQELAGDLIYRYSFRSATLRGYIKRLKASYIAPKQIDLSFVDCDDKTYTLEEVLELKEENWFSREIALASLCNQHIVDSSLEKMESLRQSGVRHQIIAVACSIKHARSIRSLYSERGYTAEVIHSDQSAEEQAKVLNLLTSGQLDCIIQVQMLGEGFDHKLLSVAAIFRPYRSLAPYIQFVGRIMRVIVQEHPGHPDNIGHIVTHLGMNLDQRLQEFKEFENDDQAFWEKVIGGHEPEVPPEVVDGSARKRISESSVVVSNEIIDALWEEDFTSLEEQHIIEELRNRLEALGLDPEQATSIVKAAQASGMRVSQATEPFVVLPQRELEEARKRLDEEAKRAAKILLNNVELQMEGKEIPFRYKTLQSSGINNFVAALMMVNCEIHLYLGKSRGQCSTEELKSAQEYLAEIIRKLTRQIKKAQSEYAKET